MILSHKHRFVFIKTHKTAGTSLEIALSRYCGPRDIITPIREKDEAVRRSLGCPGPQNYLKPYSEYQFRDYSALLRKFRRARKFRNHIPASRIRERVPEEVWRTYFKFSVIRNPFDYVVSLYFWEMRKAGRARESFRDYLMSNSEVIDNFCKKTYVDGQCGMDFVVRFENLEDDLRVLSEKLGLPRQFYDEFRSLNAKKGVRPQNATTEEMFAGFHEGVDLIMDGCREEIERFGYQPPGNQNVYPVSAISSRNSAAMRSRWAGVSTSR